VSPGLANRQEKARVKPPAAWRLVTARTEPLFVGLPGSVWDNPRRGQPATGSGKVRHRNAHPSPRVYVFPRHLTSAGVARLLSQSGEEEGGGSAATVSGSDLGKHKRARKGSFPPARPFSRPCWPHLDPLAKRASEDVVTVAQGRCSTQP